MSSSFDKLPFGPYDDKIIFDEFNYEEVNTTSCMGTKAIHICDHLLNQPKTNIHQKYLAICVPCYNENIGELMKTIISLMENIEFMKKRIRMYDDDIGRYV